MGDLQETTDDEYNGFINYTILKATEHALMVFFFLFSRAWRVGQGGSQVQGSDGGFQVCGTSKGCRVAGQAGGKKAESVILLSVILQASEDKDSNM